MERWASIEGYEGLYEVSDAGNVRTAEGKKTVSVWHGERIWKQRILKQKTDRKGYKRVTLYKDKKPVDFLVHRLVAMSFCENPNGERLVNHKDCQPSHNHYTNLEWCDYSRNILHAFENGLNNSPTKIILQDKNSKYKHRFRSMAEASEFLGKSHGYISHILSTGVQEVGNYKILKQD